MNEYMKEACREAKNDLTIKVGEYISTPDYYAGFEAAHDILVPLLREALSVIEDALPEMGVRGHFFIGEINDLVERIKQVTE